MNVVAFDLSLTSTGWADALGTGVIAPPASVARGIARLRWIRGTVLDRACGADLVVIEGYSFASRGRAIISLGELGGVVRCALDDAGLAWAEVPPSCRCLYATGKGNAPKEHVLASAIRSLGYAGHSHDEADALWLRTMALAHYSGDPSALTVKQRQALTSVAWPTLSVPAAPSPLASELDP